MLTKLIASGGIALLIAGFATAQDPPTAQPSPTPLPRISDQLAKTLDSRVGDVPTPRELREQAYAKLLEGQRHVFWTGDRVRSRAGRQNNAKLAREAFQRSVELDPMLSEGYTALAELAINVQPQDAEEAVRLAHLATRVDPNNFGARRLLGRLYSFKSRLVSGPYDTDAGQKAITEWKHVTRLDPRNAEAWAFLSEHYEKANKSDETIEALRRWLSSPVSIDARFYQMLTGGQTLTPDTAAIKLGTALLKTGRTREAIETLSLIVADDPTNMAAVDVLRDALENTDKEGAASAIEVLRQAANANPGNPSLVTLLAQTQAKAGNLDGAVTLLRDAATRVLATDKAAASVLYLTLGDMLLQADRSKESVTAYEAAIRARGLDSIEPLAEEDREFASHVFEKIIRSYRSENNLGEAKAAIERSRKVFGKDDLFADRQLIELHRETGNRAEALTAVRAVRQRVPNDYGLLRLEATLLTETGKVDEGVALVKKLMDPSTTPSTTGPTAAGTGREPISIALPQYDAFSNHLFISNLYSQANRGPEAIAAANQAYGVARGAERKQIAKLTLATAQQMSGDFKGAESTLRDLLKETPGNPIALNNLGYFLLERDDRIDEAFGLIQQAVKIDPTNPSYLDSLGWAYFKQGKLAEAERYLKDALRIHSSSGTVHEHLGDVYMKGGKLSQARTSWQRAAELYSDSADITRIKKKLASGR